MEPVAEAWALVRLEWSESSRLWKVAELLSWSSSSPLEAASSGAELSRSEEAAVAESLSSSPEELSSSWWS